MADSDFFTKSDVELLIGNDLFPAIMKIGVKRNICGSLLVFGWILSRPVLNISSHATSIAVVDGQHDSSNFWLVQELSKKPTILEDSRHNKQQFEHVANSMVKSNGMLVVIQEYNLPPNEWRLGIVAKVKLPRETLTRISEARTNYGLIQHPISELLMV